MQMQGLIPLREIKGLIIKRLEEFFRNYDELYFDSNSQYNTPNDNNLNNFNPIFKKILLEMNRIEPNNSQGLYSILTNQIDKIITTHKTRMFVFSDALREEDINYDQKLIFLMKMHNIYIDSLSIGSVPLVRV